MSSGDFVLNRDDHQENRSAGNRDHAEQERYFWTAFLIALLSNQIIYQAARFLTRGRFHFDLSLPADSAIPFLPWTVCIYFLGCFVFWFFLYRRVAALTREEADRFFCANLIGKVIAFLFFVFFPTTMTQPVPDGPTLWDACMRFIYWVDEPTNLFPSLHCFIGWLCWAGIRRNRNVSLLWHFSSLLMAVAVCLSTLTTRQHLIMDIPAGILLSELCWWLAGHGKVRHLYTSFVDRILHFRQKQAS